MAGDTVKGRASGPKNDAGDTLWYVVSGGEVRILTTRSATELSEMLKRPNQAPVSVKVMDEAIAKDATS